MASTLAGPWRARLTRRARCSRCCSIWQTSQAPPPTVLASMVDVFRGPSTPGRSLDRVDDEPPSSHSHEDTVVPASQKTHVLRLWILRESVRDRTGAGYWAFCYCCLWCCLWWKLDRPVGGVISIACSRAQLCLAAAGTTSLSFTRKIRCTKQFSPEVV